MAIYTITHTCGHQQRHDITGPEKNRESRADYYRSCVCADCYRAEQLAAAQKATADLPALTGSPKQIAWATKIRAKLVTQITEITARITDKAFGDMVRGKILSQTDSRWWIDHETSADIEAYIKVLVAAERVRRTQAESQAPAEPEIDMPALTGTPKQIAWATKIRDELLPQIDLATSAIEDRALAAKINRRIKMTDAASYWIDRQINKDIKDRVRRMLIDAEIGR